MTTDSGRPVGDNQTFALRSAPAADRIFEDFLLFEKMSTSIANAFPSVWYTPKAPDAHGHFGSPRPHQVTPPQTYSERWKKHSTFIRFSTSRRRTKGSADTERDPRGFELKFYNEEGQLGMRQQHSGIFYRDPLKFGISSHAERDPQTNLNSQQ